MLEFWVILVPLWGANFASIDMWTSEKVCNEVLEARQRALLIPDAKCVKKVIQ